MPHFPLIECHVMLAADPQQVVFIGSDGPITLPDLLVLRHVHSTPDEDAIIDPEIVGYTEDRTHAHEHQNLVMKYGLGPVRDVFPGVAPRLPAREDSIPTRLGVSPPPASAEPDAPRKRTFAGRVKLPPVREAALDDLEGRHDLGPNPFEAPPGEGEDFTETTHGPGAPAFDPSDPLLGQKHVRGKDADQAGGSKGNRSRQARNAAELNPTED